MKITERQGGMRYRHNVRLLMCAIAVFLFGAHTAQAERTVVVALFDGVAAATLDTTATPAFDRMRSEGAWSNAMEPPFPSISLIGGFTISTGCWPARHGIITNKFLDPEKGLYDHSRDADWVQGCEHMHTAAERQGVRAAALGWYASHSSTRGALASNVGESLEVAWKDKPSDSERAAEVVRQLQRSDPERPRLILAYFQGPDSAQHFSGIDSDETRAAVTQMNANVDTMMAAVEAVNAKGGEATLIVTTDHGMHPVETLINIDRILHWHDIPARAVSTGTTAFLYFDDPSDTEAINQAAEAMAQYSEAFEVLRSDHLPDYAHLGSGPRIGNLIVSARPPYFIEDSDAWPSGIRWLARWGPRFAPAAFFLKATHGYPPSTPGISGILYAWGDGIARGTEVGKVRAIDIHPTVMHLLEIDPGAPLDGEVAKAYLEATD